MSRLIPVVAHGVGLSLGTAVRPDRRSLDRVAKTIELIGAPWYSEHLAFTRVPGLDLAQLLPLPRTHQVADIVVENLQVVRQHISVPIVLENIAYYFEYPDSELGEREFIELICSESGSFVLLDLENLYINARNHGFNAHAFVDALPADLVRAVHVAGGSATVDLVIDSHDQAIPNPVLDLLGRLLERQHPDSVVLERDQAFEPFDAIVSDVRRVRTVVSSDR